ncbi:hypothetical protein GCM10008024_39760 [Allgaiera indica]|uniref:Uncharacterized protein n=1 Tax=Allgaiera indica TaxID=765699 RepID=A0AAN4UV08_9RHOB|nr:hypothetical protein GCM10008024_39760 [Allgaiera indica]
MGRKAGRRRKGRAPHWASYCARCPAIAGHGGAPGDRGRRLSRGQEAGPKADSSRAFWSAKVP